MPECRGSNPKRYKNEFPSGEPILPRERVTKLALDMGEVIRRHNTVPQVCEMVKRWWKDWKVRRDKQLEFERRRNAYAEQVRTTARLRDEKAGPPADGYWFEYFPRRLDENGKPVHLGVAGWVPPDLSLQNYPAVSFPLPVPDCETSQPEKFAALAAIYDGASKGMEKIDPWKDSPDVFRGLSYAELVESIWQLPESDEGHLRAWLAKIEDVLKAWRDAALIDRLIQADDLPRLSDDDLAKLRAYVKAPIKPPALEDHLTEREQRRKLEEILGFNDELRRIPGDGGKHEKPTDLGDSAITKAQERRKWLAEAMLLVRDHPDWSDRKIARRVSKAPSTLARSPEYQAAAAMARGDKSKLPSGHIKVDPETELTDVEAYADGDNLDGIGRDDD